MITNTIELLLTLAWSLLPPVCELLVHAVAYLRFVGAEVPVPLEWLGATCRLVIG